MSLKLNKTCQEKLLYERKVWYLKMFKSDQNPVKDLILSELDPTH